MEHHLGVCNPQHQVEHAVAGGGLVAQRQRCDPRFAGQADAVNLLPAVAVAVDDHYLLRRVGVNGGGLVPRRQPSQGVGVQQFLPFAQHGRYRLCRGLQ